MGTVRQRLVQSADVCLDGEALCVPPYRLLRAWTPSTKGTVKGDVVLAVINTPEDAEDCRGKLRGSS